jgi:hypothetical protein
LEREATALEIKAFISAARSVVRSNTKCSVGTVWMCRRLNSPLRRNPAAAFKPWVASSGWPVSRLKKTLAWA